jgi:hypothetical protein
MRSNSMSFYQKGNGYAVTGGPVGGTWIGGNSWQLYGTFLRGDFNGDGKTDIAYAWHDANNPGINLDVYQSNGTPGTLGFYPRRWETNQGSWTDFWKFLTGDFNGDGKVDVLYASADNENRLRYDLHTNDPVAPDFMTAVHNGLGGTQRASYVAAPRVPGAIEPTNMLYPFVANTSPQQLITQMITQDGRGGNYLGALIVPVALGLGAFRRQMKLGCDAGDRCRRQELAIGVQDKQLACPVEDNASARPVFVFVQPHQGTQGGFHSPVAAPVRPCFVVARAVG